MTVAAKPSTDSTVDPGPSVANLETIVSLAKRRGFVFPSSEIYGGINAVWDYGPLGVELKNNVKRAWWRAMVQERGDIVGLDAGILMSPQVWITSGHVEAFTDPLVKGYQDRGTKVTYKTYEGVDHGGAVTNSKSAADAVKYVRSRLR